MDRSEPAGDEHSTDRSSGAVDATPTGSRAEHKLHEAFDAPATALHDLERRLVATARRAHQLEQERLPAWLRPSEGEHRWPMGVAVGAAIILQLSLPNSLAIRPRFVLPALEVGLLVGLFLASPGRITKHSALIHTLVLALLGLVSIDNTFSAGLLVHEIVSGHAGQAGALLVQGAAIWATNVIVFALWYWEFDRGGPVSRAHARRRHPDLLFPQMCQPEVASPDWEPAFFDYLYTSFTNATAFSPTDTMPLSRWAKALFLSQSGVSLITVALVISRAVNIFK